MELSKPGCVESQMMEVCVGGAEGVGLGGGENHQMMELQVGGVESHEMVEDVRLWSCRCVAGGRGGGGGQMMELQVCVLWGVGVIK